MTALLSTLTDAVLRLVGPVRFSEAEVRDALVEELAECEKGQTAAETGCTPQEGGGQKKPATRAEAWEGRNLSRETRREAADTAVDLLDNPGFYPTGDTFRDAHTNVSELLAKRAENGYDTGELREHLDKTLSAHANYMRDMRKSLVNGGANEKELKQFDKLSTRTDERFDKVADTLIASSEKTEALQVALETLQEQEPDTSAEMPDEYRPIEPQQPLPEAFEKDDDWEAAHEQWESDYSNWEDETLKAESAHEDRLSKLHEIWEKDADRAQEKLDAQIEKDDRLADAFDVVVEKAHEDIHDKLDAIRDDMVSRIDEEELKDEEPDEEDADEPEPEKHSDINLLTVRSRTFAEESSLGPAIAPLALPVRRQRDGWSCGAAALQAVLDFFRFGPPKQHQTGALLGTDPKAGTRPREIIEALTASGLHAEERHGMTLADLWACCATFRPVLCPIQRHGGGHWVAVRRIGNASDGLAGGGVDVMDPSEGYVTITQKKWLDGWKDKDADGEEFVHYGIVVTGTPVASFEECERGQTSKETGCTPSEGSAGSVKAKIAALRQAIDRITDKPILRQVKAASDHLKKQTARFYGALEARYGRRRALAIMGSGQALAWGATAAGAAFGVPVWLPGSSLWGSLPALAIAEGERKLRQRLGLAVTGSYGEEDAAARQLVKDIWREYAAWLEEHKVEVLASADKFAEDRPSGSAVDQVATAGHDGDEAKRLLEDSQEHGAKVLSDLAKKALRRLLSQGAIHNATSFFDASERQQIAEALAATTATAELLGRARIRLKQQEAQKHAERFAEIISSFRVLAIVQNSPQHQDRDIDWPAYAKRFGVQGSFVCGTASVDRLWSMLKSGELRESQRLDAEDIREKAKNGDIHAVVIAREPNRSLIIVDGTHSLHAARLAGRESISAIVAEGAAGKVLERNPERFSESPWWHRFDEAPPKPLKPKKAISWFRRLIPTIKLPEEQWISGQYERAFTMVRITDTEVLSRVQDAIAKRLESGEGISSAPEDIAGILDEAGISFRNPQYPEMVFRTAMMNSYNQGSEEERQDPDVIQTFPVWRYDGIDDGREGEDHRPNFGLYFEASVPFFAVRDRFVVKHGEVVVAGRGGGRPFNCRCVATPIPYWEWRELQARGVKLTRLAA